MPVATMTSKGQITIPKEMRDDLGLVSGSKVVFVRLSNGSYRILPRTRKVSDLAGLAHDPNEAALTLEDMDEMIAEGWAESGMHGSPSHEEHEPR